MKTICAVVSNYKRPENLEPICSVLTDEPCDVIVADNSPDRSSDRYDWPGVKDVWCWKDNSYPPARWYPAVAVSHRYDYVVLIDDDAMLAKGFITDLLIMSANLNDEFSNIGPMGRLFSSRRGRWRYRRGAAHLAREDYPRADMVVRGYWMLGESVTHILRFRDRLKAEGATAEMLKQDDIILNVGIQFYTGMPSYLATHWYSKKFADERGYAFSRMNPEFKKTRCELIGLCYKVGWKSLAREDAK